MIKITAAIFCVFSYCCAVQGVHVFWYKALTNGYDLTSNPGPSLPQGTIVHEGKIVTSFHSESVQYNDAGFMVGGGPGAWHGFSAGFWSINLDDSTLNGSVDSAFLCGEVTDGWMAGNAWNTAGQIAMQIGVADVSGGIRRYRGAENIPENALWINMSADGLYYDSPCLINGTTTLDTIFGQNGRLQGYPLPSVLDKRFRRIEVTNQVRYILSNRGNFGIVFLVKVGANNYGMACLYGDETCSWQYQPCGGACINGSDSPWTSDGNTVHLVLYGDIARTDKAERRDGASGNLKLSCSNAPNPFNGNTVIFYAAGNHSNHGSLDVFSHSGSLVYSAKVHGMGSLIWDADTMASGIYHICLTVGRNTISRKAVLLR
ncbi:MAG: hypothetical protein A2268_05560 [Candidatus Raymondbacteria bacterium RifOxyA12_full_50_37]|uniref:Secretion system C-terminal sorting domain-containing protein n=1 Tax=Candidatus Raymondbacteria bacterium RIFOXYD12_FULL_49_13 TaxID=1817890 RepID=A0A1F7FBL4_UNCRA|nr:MAG: hypothetical protein A2268_05560 [Candidatus Raymondbacteria bacterium RifOxyA12_full_50_37]OGJ89031.1 MAG: hypothetical protein A2248_02795 [Candidatus Raymondbacteria bacterium RIFOXYA2_FULL_49_16]OGJ93794.1 MAG: hypothetical protein A2350_06535 [Candidatus Raymondbacteria bacterium RifOxyB12_full_50_8]OGJ97058.1 MAG: hypothetical protein A2453_04210 [Candidatus Raymondbacteria bacterium RIFOXYC2_FULL_50_21]OGK04054.1 MAG: hypothetical protein A2519_00950 [Candidatus Raymondbacteria b